MLKRFLEHSLLFVFLLALNHEGQAQVNNEPLVDRFKSFLGELSTNISLLADNSYVGTDVSNQRVWINQHFFDNAGIFDECTNQSQNIKDFISIKLPYLQKEFEFVEYNFELIKIEISNTAILKKTIRVNNSVVYSEKCLMKFSNYENGFKVQSISNILTEKNKLPSSFCKKSKKKSKILSPIIITTIGFTSIGSSLYFQSQENKFYSDYITNLSSSSSEYLFSKANNAHHTKLILRYTGATLAAVGATWLVLKIKLNKSNSSISNISVYPNEYGLTLKHKF